MPILPQTNNGFHCEGLRQTLTVRGDIKRVWTEGHVPSPLKATTFPLLQNKSWCWLGERPALPHPQPFRKICLCLLALIDLPVQSRAGSNSIRAQTGGVCLWLKASEMMDHNQREQWQFQWFSFTYWAGSVHTTHRNALLQTPLSLL